MIDPLAQFRKNAAKAVAASGGSGKPQDEYVAFGTKDRVLRLRIRSAAAVTHAPAITALKNLIYDSQLGTSLVLHFDFLMVLIRGQNLQAMTSALEGGNVDYIQEFDAARWQKPTDRSAAIIDSIEVVAQGSSSPAAGPDNAQQQTGQ